MPRLPGGALIISQHTEREVYDALSELLRVLDFIKTLPAYMNGDVTGIEQQEKRMRALQEKFAARDLKGK
jgi:hypothetical protein